MVFTFLTISAIVAAFSIVFTDAFRVAFVCRRSSGECGGKYKRFAQAVRTAQINSGDEQASVEFLSFAKGLHDPIHHNSVFDTLVLIDEEADQSEAALEKAERAFVASVLEHGRRGGNFMVVGSFRTARNGPINELGKYYGISSSKASVHDVVMADTWREPDVFRVDQVLAYEALGMPANFSGFLYAGEVAVIDRNRTNPAHALVLPPETARTKSGKVLPINAALIAAHIGTHNASRSVWIPSTRLVTDDFLDRDSAVEAFLTDLTLWVTKAKAYVSMENFKHHPEDYANFSAKEGLFHMSRVLPFSFNLYQGYKTRTPFCEKDIQVDLTMLDPYYREFAIPHGSCTETGLYEGNLQLPDQHGIFKLGIHFRRFGWNRIHTEEIIPIRNRRHNDVPRYQIKSYPFYGGSASILCGLCAVVHQLLRARFSQQQNDPTSKSTN